MEADKTILCVDDDKDTCELISFVFEQAGFEIVGCDAPQEGIRRARTNKYAAIITDFHFEEMDGTDFCRAIRTGSAPLIDGRAARVPVEIVLGVYRSSETGLPTLLG